MNDEIVGFIRYIFSNEFSSDYDVDYKVSALYVKTSLKENGIGTKLLNHVMDEFRKEDKKKMILWCLSTNESSIHFYEKMEENIKTFNDFRFKIPTAGIVTFHSQFSISWSPFSEVPVGMGRTGSVSRKSPF